MHKLDLTIRRGETVNLPIRVESSTLVYKAISAVPSTAPLRLTVTDHGLPDGWRAAIANVKGPTELNAENSPPKDKELRTASRVDDNTVEFNAVNAAGMKAYVSGGQLVYFAPHDLSAYTSARLVVKDKVGGTTLADFSTADSELELDPSAQALWLRLTDEATEALTFDKGVFDIELTDGASAVTALCSADSTFVITPEVTTPTP